MSGTERGSEFETEVERLASHLGEPAAAAVDPERMAESVLAGLRDDAPQADQQTDRQPTVLRLAAVFALATIGGLVMLQMDRPESVTVVAETERVSVDTPIGIEALGIEDLATDELVAVLDEYAMSEPGDAAPGLGLDDLSEFELEALLSSMEQDATIESTDAGV
jgi:hypothetical protein